MAQPASARGEPAYPVARAGAAAVAAFYARLGASPPMPDDADAVPQLLDAAFWASLRREEGRSPRISLAMVSPADAGQPLTFERPLALLPDALTRLSPAVERPGIHLGVWPIDGVLRIWGATRVLPDHCLVVEVVEPGLLVLKHRRAASFGKYGNIAVLHGDHLRIVDERSARLPDCPAMLAALLGLEEPASWVDAGNELVQLAISMRGHGRGGSLLVVPRGSDRWRESVVQPVSYAIAPPFAQLADLVQQPPGGPDDPDRLSGIRRLVEGIAGLTAVDGAAVLTDAYEVLAFGAKIVRRSGASPVEQIIVTEPVDDDGPIMATPSLLGGTRHLSAAQFVHDQRDALALIASQDGRFTVFAWSPSASLVHAHRIEALLL
jgi:hypothetical protein